jgi:hypothetical protein
MFLKNTTTLYPQPLAVPSYTRQSKSKSKFKLPRNFIHIIAHKHPPNTTRNGLFVDTVCRVLCTCLDGFAIQSTSIGGRTLHHSGAVTFQCRQTQFVQNRKTKHNTTKQNKTKQHTTILCSYSHNLLFDNGFLKFYSI